MGVLRARPAPFVVPPFAPANPVNGDIISVSIETDPGGMVYAVVTIKGFSTGATYDFGFSAANNNDPRTAKLRFAVRSEGFDAAGNLTIVDRTVYGTRVMRKASPNDAQLDESASGSDLVVKVALSEPIYDDDKDGGAGTSGRNPILYAEPGWCVNASDGRRVAGAAISCTNNSTADYRVPFGQWDPQTTVAATAQTADFTVGFTPRHTHGIACVRFDVTGVTSGHVQTAFASRMLPRKRIKTSLFAEAMEAGIAIAGYTQGEAMDLRCRVYPAVGDTAYDTESYTTVGEEIRGGNKIRQYCNKNDTWTYAVVNFSTGNDSTAVVSSTLATANSSPYLTVGKALQGLGTGSGGSPVAFGRVYVRSGTGSIIGTAPSAAYANTSWYTVSPYPGDTVTLTVGGFFTNLPLRLKYSGITYKLAANNVAIYGDGTSSFVWWDDIELDANGFTTTAPLNYYMAGAYLTNCVGLDISKWDDFTSGADRCAASIDGCAISGNNSNLQSVFRVVACNATGVSFRGPPTVNPAPDVDNALVECNKFMSSSGTVSSSLFLMAAQYSGAQTIGISICGNVIENTEGSSPAFELFAGGATDMATANVIVEHNTVAGQRSNVGYNDAGSTRYPRLGWSVKNNAFRDWNVKGDEFAPGNANRTGAWPIQYGQNFGGNRYEQSTFPGMFVGPNTDTSATMNYTTNASATGTDAGGGDYAPTLGSDLIGNAWPGQVRWDLFGHAVIDDVGAVQV